METMTVQGNVERHGPKIRRRWQAGTDTGSLDPNMVLQREARDLGFGATGAERGRNYLLSRDRREGRDVATLGYGGFPSGKEGSGNRESGRRTEKKG